MGNNSVTKKEYKKGKKNLKKIIGTILFIVFNVAVILYTALNEFTTDDNAVKFKDIQLQWIYIIPAALCCILAIVIETIKYALVMKKTCGYVNIKLCLETVLFGRYYDNITPSGIGGQPYQIYHMSKNGVPAAESSAIPLSAFISMQYGFVILAIVCFVFGASFMKSDVTRIAGYFGTVMYALFPTIIILFTFFPNGSLKILTWGVKVLNKIKIIKDKEKTIIKVENSVGDYVKCVKEITRSKGLIFEIMALGVLYQIAICSIPYFVIYAFGGTINYLVCFCTTVSIYAAITFIPTPGNMGAAEGTFYAVFSMLSAGYVFWGMLTWRFFVCYIFILAGLIVYLLRAIFHKREKHE